jgi:uncharacterized membrane-anchored protein
MNNIPRLNTSYWLLMLICTTMGELLGNLISRNFELGYTQGALADIFVFSAMIFVVLFFKMKTDIAYWLLILMGNIGGTNLADWVTLDPLANDMKWGFLKPLELGTEWGSVAVMTALVMTLVARSYFSKNKSEDSFISSTFYWIAILLSSTFGTTSGDFITNDTPLGAFGGSLFLLGLIVLVFFAYKYGRIARSSAYWLCLVLMHPVGATLGNYVSKPIGLNLGNVVTNEALIAIFILIFFFNRRTSLTRANTD